jgi:serine protease AprX
VDACRGRPSREGRVLAIFDNGAAANHPWLNTGLGRLHFQPGTPGGPDSPGLGRSHGTAMLGIYAQAALGLPLTTDGALLLPDLRQPIAIADTLIALAGPENPQGQVALARNLNWMLMASGGRPFPDLLNYSQGNGPICIPEETPACADAGWTPISRLVDRASADYAVLIVKSAGNAGFDATRTRVTIPGDSFNALVVGNMHAFDWDACTPGGARVRHRLHRQSSVGARAGPTLIDLVAPGVRIDTAGVDAAWCKSVCEDAEACAFCRRLGHRRPGSEVLHKRNSGTSPAAAMAGVAALRLMQSGLVNPLAVKAVLMNSAEPWDSHDTPVPDIALADCGKLNSASPHGPATSLVAADRQYGHGYLDAAQALAAAERVVVDRLVAKERVCFALAGEGPWKITLTWAMQQMGKARPARLTLKDLGSGTVIAATHPSDTTLQFGLAAVPERDASRTAGAARLPAPRIEIAQHTPEMPEGATVFALAASTPMQRLAACP